MTVYKRHKGLYVHLDVTLEAYSCIDAEKKLTSKIVIDYHSSLKTFHILHNPAVVEYLIISLDMQLYVV